VRGLSGAHTPGQHPLGATHPSWDVTRIPRSPRSPPNNNHRLQRSHLQCCPCPWQSMAKSCRTELPRAQASHTAILSYLSPLARWRTNRTLLHNLSSSMHRSSCHMSHSRLLHPRKLPGPNVAIRPCSDVGAPLRLYAMSSDLQFVQRPVRRTRKRVCPSLRHPLLLPVLTSA
jgi:hypothetical protein